MTNYRKIAALLPTISLLMLPACGGGSAGSGVSSTPAPPPPPPPPPPAQSVEIFNAPVSQEFTTLTPGGAVDGIRIRYNASSGTYEVMPGDSTQWQGLRPHPSYSSTPNHYFAFGPTALNDMSFFFTRWVNGDPGNQYQYANIAIWGDKVGAYWDDASYTAFGIATPTGAVPVTGSASYSGDILGTTSYREPDYLVGGTVAATISGSISLAFNFQSGTLSGSMHPTLSTFGSAVDLGVVNFRNTVFASGATGFAGAFDTAAVGTNGFNGVFAGPAAQEVMGRWNLPFVLPSNGQTYDAWGAFIGRK